MSSHTPYIVVQLGVIAPEGALYKVRDGEQPLYDRVATGPLKGILEMAGQMNYAEAEKNGQLTKAVVENLPAGEDGTDGIPTETDYAREAIEKITEALDNSDAGRLNLPNFKRVVERIIADTFRKWALFDGGSVRVLDVDPASEADTGGDCGQGQGKN